MENKKPRQAKTRCWRCLCKFFSSTVWYCDCILRVQCREWLVNNVTDFRINTDCPLFPRKFLIRSPGSRVHKILVKSAGSNFSSKEKSSKLAGRHPNRKKKFKKWSKINPRNWHERNKWRKFLAVILSRTERKFPVQLRLLCP